MYTRDELLSRNNIRVGETYLKVLIITNQEGLWSKTAEYAAECSWSAGKSLACKMKDNDFCDWERVFVAVEGNEIAGFCTLTKTDCIPDVEYTPYISFVFVNEHFRGNRLSEMMISHACKYANEIDFNEVYLVSGERGLYEKYGFEKIDERMATYGKMAQLFRKQLR